jgi:prepilin-type N-terminal cleavage/methylation domain-containing protein/prepilin-type processing-associated H-X9-DG protein
MAIHRQRNLLASAFLEHRQMHITGNHAGTGIRRGFTLIELLVVIAIIGVLSSILLPSLAKAKRKARTIEEVSSAKQLVLAAQIYADENEDAVFPGYVTDAGARDDLGNPLSYPVNARYPWRISPYLAQSFETIYCADNRRKLDDLRGLDRNSYVYAVSLYPSLGINSYFIGGNESELPAETANRQFGSSTVITRTTEARRPSDLMMFVSARSAVSGLNANGYFQVTPPYLTGRKWAASWSPGQAPNQWGFVAPRYDGRAVAAMVDGHVQMLNQHELQDMRHWANTADRPDFVLRRQN